MRFGVVFPQTDFGVYEPGAVTDYAQTVEGLGYSHIVAYDHVLGANPNRPGGWTGPYTVDSAFLEPFVLFSFMAGITQKMGFLSGIIILPQRQTALVAKQAASLDVLCKGRLRLGFGLGWNAVEYTALNENFHNRGKRVEEQVKVLRLLFTQRLVDFTGQWHSIPDAGVKPLPLQKPIPIWFGGTVPAAIQRAARLGDGWLPNYRTAADARSAVEQIHQELQQVGRDPAAFGIEARLPYGDGNPDSWREQIYAWQELGATRFSINTLNLGFTNPNQHLDAVKRFASEIGPFTD